MNAPATISCMGGWCVSREACQHYVTVFRGRPEERLCEPMNEIPTPLVTDEVGASRIEPYRTETN